jgi:hypothetical protein
MYDASLKPDLYWSCQENMTMGNIECILAEVNNLSDSDLKILVNKIMDRSEAGEGVRISGEDRSHGWNVRSAILMHMLLETVTNMVSRHFCAGHAENHMLQRVTRFCAGSRLAAVVWKTVLADTLMGVSLDDTRDGLDLQHIKISHTRLFFMRHKIMLALEDLQEISPAMVEEVVEADETYVPESEKGTKFGPDAKRKPRKRGTPAIQARSF